jgi:hypothetical protein
MEDGIFPKDQRLFIQSCYSYWLCRFLFVRYTVLFSEIITVNTISQNYHRHGQRELIQSTVWETFLIRYMLYFLTFFVIKFSHLIPVFIGVWNVVSRYWLDYVHSYKMSWICRCRLKGAFSISREFEGTLTRKKLCQSSICLQYEPLIYFKNFWSSV